MSRFKVVALVLVVMLAVVPLAALAQDDQEYEEFASDDGLMMASVPVEWATSSDETSPFPLLVLINSEAGMERIMGDEDPISGDQGIMVYVFPTDFFGFLGVSITDDMTPEETVTVMSELFFAPPVDDAGNVLEDEATAISEPQAVEVSDERTVGAVMIEDATTEGVFMTFRPGEGLLGLVLAVAYPGEYTDELNLIAETVVASVEYAGSSDDLMMSILTGAVEEAEPEVTEEMVEEATEDAADDMSGDDMSGDTSALDGKALIETQCSVCHTTERIYNADKDEAGWTTTVDRMIGYGAALDDAERQAVLVYLVENH